jgi:hypothetical protein
MKSELKYLLKRLMLRLSLTKLRALRTSVRLSLLRLFLFRNLQRLLLSVLRRVILLL